MTKKKFFYSLFLFIVHINLHAQVEGESVIPDSYTNNAKPEYSKPKQDDKTNNIEDTNAKKSTDNGVKSKDLEDVVVVGYGTQKRKDLTGAIGKVEMSSLDKAAVRSFDEALAGRVAGVQVTSSDGQPGSNSNIVIRGNSSATQDNSPLYVIDGFPVEDQNLNAINPKDIESIDILKDASATSIYGARAANGVILVTTKRGKLGPPSITFNTFVGIQDIIKRPAMMNAYDFVKYQLELDTNAKNIYLKNGRNLDYYTDTAKTIDWQSQLYQQAITQSYGLAISGGNATTKYAVSGSYLKQGGIVINSNYTRYQGKLSLDQKVSAKIKMGATINYSYLAQGGISPAQQISSSGTSGAFAPFYNVFGARPTNIVEATDDGGIENDLIDELVNTNNDYRINPIINLKNLYRQNTTKNIIANLYGEYEIIKNLKLKITAGINSSQLKQEAFNNENTQFGNTRFSTVGINGSIVNRESNNLLNENTLNYTKNFNQQHNLGILVGITEQSNLTSINKMGADHIPNSKLGINSLGQGIATPVTNESSLSNLMSFLGRITYNFKSKYLMTFSYRADGSSKFISTNRWGYFPSGSVAWNFADEKWVQQLKSKNNKIISQGKLRISYGTVGNNRVSDFPYVNAVTNSFITGYSFNNNTQLGTVLGNNSSGGPFLAASTPTTLGNPALKWETTTQLDIGLDIGLFSQRIVLGFDVYDKTTTDLLLITPTPASSGYTNTTKNIGSIQNRGLEISIASININVDDFKWVSDFNIAFNKSKVLSFADNQNAFVSTVNFDNSWSSVPAYISRVGQPLGQMYGYVSDGLYQLSDFDKAPNGTYILKNYITTNGNSRERIKPGDIKYKDINNDGVVNTSDYAIIGNGLPLHTGGFTNNFSYKGIDLNVFFQWSYGNDIMNANRIVFEGNGLKRAGLNQFASYNDRWSFDNQGSPNFRAGGFQEGAYSSRYVEDGSYIRLKTVSLSYSLPKQWLEKIKIKQIKIYVSGQNLYTWTKYSGFDPEVNVYPSALTTGFDYSTYPRARSIVAGLDMSL